MLKNLQDSTNAINRRRTLVLTKTGQKRKVLSKPPYASIIKKVTDITQRLTKTKALKGVLVPTSGTWDQQDLQWIFFKLESLDHDDLFIIKAPPLGEQLYEALFYDLKPITDYFAQRLFNPYFQVFIKAKYEIEAKYGLESLCLELPPTINKSLPKSLAQKIVDLLYLFVTYVQDESQAISIATKVNDFDKRARQNSASLKTYLQKLLRKHKNLAIVKANIALQSYDCFKLGSHDLSRKNMVLATSYQTLATARSMYLKKIQQHPLIGKMLVGYIWKLRDNPSTIWCYEVLMLFDTQLSFRYTATEIQEICEDFWLQCDPEACLIGYPHLDGHESSFSDTFISHGKGFTEKIDYLIQGITRTDYLVQIVAPNRGRTFGKGGVPKRGR